MGFVFPVYYVHVPEIALSAIKGLSLGKGQQVFAIATYAGSWGYAFTRHKRSLIDKDVICKNKSKRPVTTYLNMEHFQSLSRIYPQKLIHK